MVIYKGSRQCLTGHQPVTRNGEHLDPGPSIAVHNHAPEFNWGYGGSGPAQLALALLLDATKDEELSDQLHQPFKEQFVANCGDEWEITDMQILAWVAGKVDVRFRQQITDLEGLTGKPTGIGRIDRGECPEHYISPGACMFCPYGHMLECHHPHTCEEAECSHQAILKICGTQDGP